MVTGPETPPDVALVLAFINTIDLEAGVDGIDRPSELASWLRGHDLLKRGARLSRAELKRAGELREALRELAGSNAGRPLTPAAVSILDRESARARLGRLFGRTRVPAGWDEVAGRLLLSVIRARADGSWMRLKTCSNEACRWAFFDRSRNRSGLWCAMSVCGSRLKMRSYRQRHASIESGAR